MQIVKVLSPTEREAYRGFTTAGLRKLLCDPEEMPKSLAVGALAWPSTIGLALVELGRGEYPILRSIVIAKPYRNGGMGKALLREVEAELRREGAKAVVVEQLIEADEPAGTLTGLLKSVEWSPMRASGLFCETTYELILNARWVHYHTFPPGFETFRWADLRADEKDLFVAADRELCWYPELLNPFTHRELVHLPTSVGLRYRGELIGWCVTYAYGANDLTVASLFVKAEFQPRGHAIRLLAYAIEQGRGCGRENMSFNVSMTMTGMLQFFRKHVKPYLTSARWLFRSVTPLERG